MAKKQPIKVHVVTYEWRNWSRDVFAFSTADAASAHVINEAGDAADGSGEPIASLDDARKSLNESGHTVYVDTLLLLTPPA